MVGWPTLRRQFWADIHGKEVFTASTYSYTWIADQMGHVALGFLLGGIILRVAIEFGLSSIWAVALAISATIAIFGLWELHTFRWEARQAGSLSVGEQRLLKHNAIIATIYMVLGAIATTAFLPS